MREMEKNRFLMPRKGQGDLGDSTECYVRVSQGRFRTYVTDSFFPV